MAATDSLPSGWSERVALLFYLALLDEAISSRLATKCAADVRSAFLKVKKQNSSGSASDIDLLEQIIVKTSAKLLQSRKKPKNDDLDSKTKAAKWQVPKNVDLGPWRQFQKEGGLERNHLCDLESDTRVQD